MSDNILVTDWEEVDEGDFYLSKEWLKEVGRENMKIARRLQKESQLYIGYVVSAVSYALYSQMDASQVFIDSDMNEILYCESAVIDNDHKDKVEFSGY